MTLLEYIPFIDDKIIWAIKSNFSKNYHFLIDKELYDKKPTTIATLVIPSDEFKIDKIEDDQSRFEFEYWKKMNVTWHYSLGNIGQNTESIQFDFWAIGYINVSSQNFSTEILDPNKFYLKKVWDLKLRNLKQLEIPSLFNYQSEYITNNFLDKFLEVCRGTKHVRAFSDFNFANELVFLSQDLCFILCELCLYKPYLRDFLENPINTGNKTIYTYFPSLYDKQYFHLASNFLQTAYNFWDRIGDLLYHYFDFPKLKFEKDVYFDRVMNQFPEKYKNDSFDFLSDFFEGDFKKFNNARKLIVHYNGIESQVFGKYIENSTNKDEIEKLQEWKINLIDEYIEIRNRSFIGIECAMKLIETKNNY